MKEENRKNKYQIQTKAKEREGKNKRIAIVIYANTHLEHGACVRTDKNEQISNTI